MGQNGSLNYGAAAMQIREAAVKDERARLRPLLERCRDLARWPRSLDSESLRVLAADISRELGSC